MQRRQFVKLLAASCFYQPNLFASAAHTIYCAPAMPSIVIAKAALELGGCDVKIWKNPDQLRAGVASGLFSVMMSPANVCATLFNKGFDVGYVNFLTHSINSIMSKNAPINSPKELQNTKLIMPFKNDMPDIVLKTLLKHYGVDSALVDITYTSTPAEALALFLSKDDFGVAYLPEPMASAAVLKGKMKAMKIYRGFNSYDLWRSTFNKDIFQAGIIANKKYFAQNQNFFNLLHKSLQNAHKWVQANPDEAANIGTNLLNAPQKALAGAISHSNLCVISASEAKADVLEFLRIIAEYNPALIGGKMPGKEIFLQ